MMRLAPAVILLAWSVFLAVTSEVLAIVWVPLLLIALIAHVVTRARRYRERWKRHG